MKALSLRKPKSKSFKKINGFCVKIYKLINIYAFLVQILLITGQ